MTDKDDFVGIVTISTTSAIKEDDFWSVTQKVIQKRTTDGVDWEEKEVSMKARDTNLDTAFKQAVMSIAIYLDNLGGDLFVEDLKDFGLVDEDLENLPTPKYIQ